MSTIDQSNLLLMPGSALGLHDFDPGFTCMFETKRDARAQLRAGIVELAALQDKFYAQGLHALLVIFQGMDGAGKDGAIKHVMTGVNPQGVDVAVRRSRRAAGSVCSIARTMKNSPSSACIAGSSPASIFRPTRKRKPFGISALPILMRSSIIWCATARSS
jgi:hypothetical protein